MKNLKKITLACLIAVMASGCQTTRQNAMTGEEEASATAQGVLGGCIGGAIAGAIINKGKGAAIGCAAGGVVGGVVGQEFDKQEAALRQELVSSGVQVKRVGEDKIELVLDGDISFATGKSDVSSAIKPSLSSVAKIMNEYPETKLIIEGHTDSVGSEASNLQLSKSRAYSVRSVLGNYGLGFDRMAVEAYGEKAPICTNKTKEGQSCNRRVELMIVPK